VTLSSDVVLTDIAAGFAFTCATTDSGDVLCWGANQFGQLGDGSGVDQSLVPTKVVLPPGVKATTVATGVYHACAVTTDGAVLCWGHNTNAQLGDGTTTDSGVPVQVFPVQIAVCGDGRIDGNEECDDGGGNGHPGSCCADDCSAIPGCTTTTLIIATTTSSSSSSTAMVATTTTSAPPPACVTIGACQTDIEQTLPEVTGRDPKRDRTSHRLAKQFGRAAKALDRAASDSAKRQLKDYAKARRALKTLLAVAKKAARKGTLGVPLARLESAVRALLDVIG
jgi:hypothetical protein